MFGNVNIPPQPSLQDQLWEQMQAYQQQMQQMQSQVGNISDMFQSGRVTVAGDDGLAVVPGGRNKYGIVRPDFTLMRDASGSLDPRFQQTMSPEFMAMREKAMASGDTESARLARERQNIMAQAQRDQLQQQAGSNVAMAMRNLGMRGGSSAGARERIQRDMGRSLMSGQQGVGRENRLANLAISQQDEAMKNQLLGQSGTIAQKIEEANINRLQQDVTNQNIAAQKMYEEDMRAYSAQKGAQAQASASRAAACFLDDTLFLMDDGSYKRVADIDLGDIMAEGGQVTTVLRALSDDLYMYNGAEMVTGSHAVKENGEWIRVRDSKLSKKIQGDYTVYSVANKKHIMLTDHHVYSDLYETDFYEIVSEKESLEMLNGRLDIVY